MPGMDGTGPRGTGAMTGRGRGSCATDEPGTVGRFARGGFGIGRGWRRMAPRTMGAGRGLGAGARGRGRWL